MDLLTGYGSDASDNDYDDIPRPNSESERNSEKLPASSGPLPPTAPSTAHTSAKLDEDELKASNGTRSKLWSQLPQPTGSSASTGLSALPPPSGGGALAAGRKVVSLPLPFRKELLAAALDSDEEDEPAAKRVKTTGAKSRLMDFLPPPKHSTGSALPPRALGSGPSLRPAAGPGKASEPTGQAVAGGTGHSGLAAAGGAGHSGPAAAGAIPADFFAAGVSAPYGNEAYRVADDDAAADGGFPGPSGADAAATAQYGGYAYGGGAYDQTAAYDYAASYYAQGYGPGPGAGPPPPLGTAAGPAGRAMGGAAAAAGGADLIEEALRAEQERASKRGGGAGAGVKLVEINAKDLTRMDPAAREAANSARDALGPDYALSLRRTAAPFEGSKMARRKHQIGTLLFNARMQELEQMEKRTQGQKSKAETAAKYGW